MLHFHGAVEHETSQYEVHSVESNSNDSLIWQLISAIRSSMRYTSWFIQASAPNAETQRFRGARQIGTQIEPLRIS